MAVMKMKAESSCWHAGIHRRIILILWHEYFCPGTLMLNITLAHFGARPWAATAWQRIAIGGNEYVEIMLRKMFAADAVHIIFSPRVPMILIAVSVNLCFPKTAG